MTGQRNRSGIPMFCNTWSVGKALCFFVISSLIACGSQLGDNALSNDESLTVGEVRELDVPINYAFAPCFGGPLLDDDSVCSVEKNLIVYIPDQVAYAGEPETRLDFSDVVFGETDIEEPEIRRCNGGFTAVSFEIPRIQVTSDDSDNSILEDILGDIIDATAEKFVFKVRGVAAKAGVTFHVADLGEESDGAVCDHKDKADRFLRINVNESP